jgi:hypothetical protein
MWMARLAKPVLRDCFVKKITAREYMAAMADAQRQSEKASADVKARNPMGDSTTSANRCSVDDFAPRVTC